MPWWTYLIIGAVALVVYNVIINTWRLRRVAKIRDMFDDWIEKKSYHYIEYSEEALELFEKAGLKDGNVSVTQLVGYNRVSYSQVSVFQNATVMEPNIIAAMSQFFLQSIGVFRRRRRDSLNPICWIETFIFMPRYITSYLGLKKSTITKILQILWWIIAPLAIAFRDKIFEFFSSLF